MHPPRALSISRLTSSIVINSIATDIFLLYYSFTQPSLMKKRPADTIHVWLVLMKAFHAMAKYGAAGIEHTGLGNSDFRVLEVLQHKGPLPVNTIGPKVNLNPGSISVAVDRLEKKALVKRRNTDDRRVRLVELTAKGRALITKTFREHAAAMEEAAGVLSNEERLTLLGLLKKLGKAGKDKP